MPPKIKQKGSIGFDKAANAMVGDHGAVKENPMYDADEEKEGFGFPTEVKALGDRKMSAVDANTAFTEPKWLKTSKKEGTDMSLYRSAEEAKADQKVLPVFHKFMAKFLEEDTDGNINMLGTIIQQASGISMDNDDATDDFKFNKFRVNDVGADGTVIELRREVPVPHFGTRATYNANIPMQKTSVFTVPPYEIFKATGLIELQTSSRTYPDLTAKSTKTKKTCEVRPDIFINWKDERELFVTRKVAEINKTDSYEMICSAPRLKVMYDKKKKYCPKYEVTWYMEKPPGSQIVTTFAPLLFTALLACLNVVNAEGAGPALDNSISLCLTIVFVLPNLRVDGRGHSRKAPVDWPQWFLYVFQEYFLSNNAIVFFFFLGLAFTSIAHPNFFDSADAFVEENPSAAPYVALTGWYKKNNVTGYTQDFGFAERFGVLGMFFFLVAHIIPVINYIRYYRFKKAIVASSFVKLGAHGANTLGNAEAEDAAKEAAKKALAKIIADNSKRQEGSITFNANFLLNADADGDGMMSLEEAEAQGVTKETFLAMDADGDGQVTKDEFKAWLEAGPEVMKALAAHKKATADPRFDLTRLAFGKDKSFDQWELNDNSGGVAKLKKPELSERVESMRSVNDVWTATPKGYTPGNETVDNAASPMWRRDPENKKDVYLVCGPTHV